MYFFFLLKKKGYKVWLVKWIKIEYDLRVVVLF